MESFNFNSIYLFLYSEKLSTAFQLLETIALLNVKPQAMCTYMGMIYVFI